MRNFEKRHRSIGRGRSRGRGRCRERGIKKRIKIPGDAGYSARY